MANQSRWGFFISFYNSKVCVYWSTKRSNLKRLFMSTWNKIKCALLLFLPGQTYYKLLYDAIKLKIQCIYIKANPTILIVIVFIIIILHLIYISL